MSTGAEMVPGTSLSYSQVDRLPKSVQDEITRLVKSVQYWRKLAEVGPEDSDTFRHLGYDGTAGEIRQALGTGPQIEFVLDGRTRVDASLEDGVLTLSARVSSTRDLFAVQPWAANMLKIRVIEGGDR